MFIDTADYSLQRSSQTTRRLNGNFHFMDVEIVIFPETKVAAIEHFGAPALEHDSARKLIAWKLENRLLDPLKHRSYGVHHTDPRVTPPAEHHVDFCLSIEEDVCPNPYGVINKVIPACRCARARDIGSRSNNKAAVYLYEKWLPQSGESLGDFPIFFHYVSVGSNVREEAMITDVYLHLRLNRL
jgi:AraC family transcriptional regulator